MGQVLFSLIISSSPSLNIKMKSAETNITKEVDRAKDAENYAFKRINDISNLITPINFTKVIGDPVFSISGYRLGNIAMIQIHWVNEGSYPMNAWDSTKLATMNFTVSRECFLYCCENSGQDAFCTFSCSGNSIYYRSTNSRQIPQNCWHDGGGIIAGY